MLANLIECRSIARRSTKTLARDRRPQNSPNAETDPLGWSPTVRFGSRCGRREREVVFAWKRRSQASQRRMDENLALGRGCLLARAHPTTGQSSRVKPRRCSARHVRPAVQCRSISSLEQGNPSRASAGKRGRRPQGQRKRFPDSVGCHGCRLRFCRLLTVSRNILSSDWRFRPCIGRPAGPGAWRR